MPAQALAALATLLSCTAHGNRLDLALDRGSAEMTWLTPASFHFRRVLDGPLSAMNAPDTESEPASLQVEEAADFFQIRSKRIEVRLAKRGVLVSVRKLDGARLMADLSAPRPDSGLVTWDREMRDGVRFYGLGASTDPELDLRGKSVQSPLPFLLSTAGYGEYYPGIGAFRFDFTANGRYRVEAPQQDYYFYSGATPKEIFEEHKGSREFVLLPPRPQTATWGGLRDALLQAVHQAISGKTLPRFNLAAYSGADEELLQRARQLGSLAPAVNAGMMPMSAFRQQLNSFFDVYEIDLRDHGYPLWHALPFQFPTDPECARHADEFMLGDEMLIAPIYQSGNKRQVYLPPGNWTNLETNQEYPGRQTIGVETTSLPVFAKNGAIVPLDSEGGIGLHYFPKAGGEFFLLERDVNDYTQVHAAPALDVMRLEIESKKERDYQWVVHHVERPRAVGFEDVKYEPAASAAALKNGGWFYDAAARNLIVRVRVKAGEDRIINLSW